MALQASGQLDQSRSTTSKVVVAFRNGSSGEARRGRAKVSDSVENDKTRDLAQRRPGDRARDLQKQPDANTVAAVDAVLAKLPALRAGIPPSVEHSA